MDWSDEKDMALDTMKEFEALCDECFSMKAEIDDITQILKEKKAKLSERQEKVIAYLEEYGKTKHTGRMGNVHIKVDSYPPMPKDPTKKEAFMNYLKKQGVYEDMVTVNAQTLKGYYKAEMEANEDDPFFKIPGLDPYEKKTLGMRKSK